jgi:hypothetical protein
MSSITRKKKILTFTFDAALVERLRIWMENQPVPPQRNSVVAKAIDEFLARNEVSVRKEKS